MRQKAIRCTDQGGIRRKPTYGKVTVTSTDPTSGRNDKDTSWPASRNLGNGRLGKISHPDFRQKPGGQVRHSAKITADVPLLDPAMKRDPGRRTKSAKTGGQVVGIRNDKGLVVLSCWVFVRHLSFRRIRRRRRLRNLKLKGWLRFLGAVPNVLSTSCAAARFPKS